MGYNGQAKDDEVYGKGSSYAYNTRLYNPRIIRTFTVDPMANKYPDLSPFSFVNNNTIVNKEVNGSYWLDYKVCDYMDKDHFKAHGGNYTMITSANYRFTEVAALKTLNYGGAVPFAPEISWTATALKMGLAMKDNSVGFGLSDWAGVILNLTGAGVGKTTGAAGKAGAVLVELNRTGASLTLEMLQEFKSTDYYQLYLDQKAGQTLMKQGILVFDEVDGMTFSKGQLEKWHKEGVELAKSGDKAFMEKYKVDRPFGTSAAGAPAAYVKDKIKETIENARQEAAKELEDKASSNSNSN